MTVEVKRDVKQDTGIDAGRDTDIDADIDLLEDRDRRLRHEAELAVDTRRDLGLEGLVGGLQCVIINAEQERQAAAAREMLSRTGLLFDGAFEDQSYRTCVLMTPATDEFGSADFLVRSTLSGKSPFESVNRAPKTSQHPNTRLETFVFEVRDIEKYVSIQREAGVRFMTVEIEEKDNYSFIQTEPSSLTGNSIGFIQWRGRKGDYAHGDADHLDWEFEKPDLSYLRNIRWLDHAATRVKAQDRDAAIIEFIRLTGYRFDFAVYVASLNSITSVARLSPRDFAMVFTSGIDPYTSDETSGPTEMFIRNYGTRVHHIAFDTVRIEDTFESLKADGMEFLIELVGSPDEGLKQTFSMPSKETLIVNEYIHRYGGFDGFFTRSNVTLLTAATAKQ